MLNVPINAESGPQCRYQMAKLKRWKRKASFVDSATSLKQDLLIESNLQQLQLDITAITKDLKQN